MPVNYQNGKIYKLWSLSTDDIYIGSTTQPLTKRLTKHRSSYKQFLKGNYHYVSSFKIIECGDYKIELIEKVECKCKEELIAREGYYIRTLKCVNKVIPNRTDKEYYEDNKKLILDKNNIYRLNNLDQIKTQQKKNYINKREYKLKQVKEIYQKKKHLLAEKITCECGSVVSKSGLTAHKKTRKHIKNSQ